MSGPKTLTIDIETAPAKAYVWGLWNQNISPGQIIEPSRMISFAAKWVHEDRVRFYSEFHHDRDHMVTQAWRLLDEADVVVTYNGDRFDIPHLNREFQLSPWLPGDPAPFTSVDLYKVIKKNQVWMSHKLAYITQQLELSGKLGHEGFSMWVKCLDDGHPEQRKAWNAMRRYNKRDVKTTEELYGEMLPHVKNIPAAALFRDEGDNGEPQCPNCGSEHVQRRGWALTRRSRYPRYQCQTCGTWSKGARRDLGVVVA